MATVAEVQQIAQQMRAEATSTEAADAAILGAASEASRAQVIATMRDLRHFDPYLHFASAEDEDAYRKREAARTAYIDAELAKGTPEGNLNASGGAIGQMADAKANGAGDSPEFQKRWGALIASTEKLREEVRRSGGSTAEFDARLREDLRAILKAKGLSDAEIDARFAAYPDPLEAMKAFVSEQDVDALTARVNLRTDEVVTLPTSATTTLPAASQAVVPDNLSGALADLGGLGFVAAEHDPAVEPSHGVSASLVVSAHRGATLS